MAAASPPSIPSSIISSPERRTPMIADSPIASRTAATTLRGKSVRPSRSPPNASVRRFIAGERKLASSMPCAIVTSMPSRSPSRQRRAAAR
ncbi:hypothetical protein VQ03_02370 [Methylobacterium tarhaniae]|uniref:Uncharacterized protein n=1 Tax=Methylobacterium tarhaniae TaxID=1187852 RepID=A0A0J6VZ69_9HYPH|nr:hypothetical protein VQ03_02370 [Methylobacterium tarhaniae]